MNQERAVELARRLAATEPRREGHGIANRFDTPYDAFPFVGDGPFYEFTSYRWTGVSVASALNYFRQINATVVQHERRSYVISGGTYEDGQTGWYDYYLVEWKPRKAA